MDGGESAMLLYVGEEEGRNEKVSGCCTALYCTGALVLGDLVSRLG